MALPGYVGLCRISGGAHGYSFVGEIVQIGDNEFLRANANDVGEESLRVTFTRPLAGTEFRDTAVDRLYRAVWGWPGDRTFPPR